MQVKIVRHDRGTQDADGDVEHGRVADDLTSGHQTADNLPDLGARHDQLDGKAKPDGSYQSYDQRLQVPESFVLKQENEEHVQGGQTHTPHQRNAEKKIERDRRTDDFGQIAGGNRYFAEHPQDKADRTGVMIPAGLGEIATSGDTQLEGERLKQNGHQVGQQNHAQQGIAEPGTSREVGGPVSRVHVPDGDHVSRAGKRQRLAPKGDSPRDLNRVV